MASASYAAILRDATRARWDLEAATSTLVDLDFALPFLPEDLVHSQRLPFLGDRQRVLLSQIRAHSYLEIFVLAEKFILPFVMSQAAQRLHRDSEQFLALMSFGQEEAKHIALFERFSEAFARGFETTCDVMGPAEDITALIMAHDSLAVGLAVLHIEWMTQVHYVRAARDNGVIDPRFKELLRLHWREEAQHARLDGLLLAEMASESSRHARTRAVNQYLEILDCLARGFEQQVLLDIAAFERVDGPLDEGDRQVWTREQTRSYGEVFLRQGLDHDRFRAVINEHFNGPYPALDAASERWKFV